MSYDPPPPGPGQDPAGQGNRAARHPRRLRSRSGTRSPVPARRATASRVTASRATASSLRPTASKQGYGQQPPGYPPPGAPGGYGQAPPQTSPLAIVSLVLGIVGFLCCTFFVLSIGAVVTGFLARKQIEESQGRLKGSGMATAGLILGAVGRRRGRRLLDADPGRRVERRLLRSTRLT